MVLLLASVNIMARRPSNMHCGCFNPRSIGTDIAVSALGAAVAVGQRNYLCQRSRYLRRKVRVNAEGRSTKNHLLNSFEKKGIMYYCTVR